ncbi:MAG: pseudouridine synthase [Acidobacteriota bacterium]|nr:pseudouridine synthase [Acidobacteriota bacterium]
MTDPLDHPAEGPEQEIASDAEAGFERAAQLEPEPPEATPEAEVDSEQDAEDGEQAPAPRLERLQKILAQAGIASRRHAEELITEGRVQVNGQTITVLGAKADPARDHIRVDGKLLHGAERLRYFMLNKPKGYVTTVSDPEGRPTVMEFFSRLGERLYPVGRLDYLSEGLLLVTNDGPLANELTRAANGVEKTYLVKVSGQPTEENLERLRTGVTIARGSTNPAAPPVRKNAGKVRTAPARIKQIRAGNNPWFEVILTEGRNRELRKMFEEIGHHVEKIRRVGYGPLALDVEPGKMRELIPEEVEALRLSAAGKLKPRRLRTTHMLPKEAGMTTEEREQKRDARKVRNLRGKPLWNKPGTFSDRAESDRPPRQSFDRNKPYGSRQGGHQRGGFDRPQRPRAENGESPRFERTERPRTDRPRFERPRPESAERPRFEGRTRSERPKFDRGERPKFERTERPQRREGSKFDRSERPKFDRGSRPRLEQSERPRPAGRTFERPARSGEEGRRPFRPSAKPAFGEKPRFSGKPKFEGKPRFEDKPKFEDKPRFSKKPRFEISEVSDAPSRPSSGPRSKSGPPVRSASGPRPGGKPGFAGRPKFTGKPGTGGKPAFSDRRSGPKSGPKTGSRPTGKPGGKFGGKPGRVSGKGPVRKSGGKPGGRPPGKRRG